ncbi:MAG: GDSL-type esterase/lipase family protein [Deltaproteobacteria bacterium]
MASAKIRKSAANLTHRVAVVVSLAAFVGCATPTEWRRQQQNDFEDEEAQIIERQPTKKRGKRKRRRRRRSRDPAARELDGLALKLGAAAEAIENPCKNPLCTSRALDPFFKKLDEIQKDRDGHARVLHLGDSHIAADYITRVVRRRLQERFGNGGRGFVAIDQRARYGGRRLKRAGFTRTRIVDKGHGGEPFGFSGMAIHAARGGAKVSFELEPEDDDLVVYYLAERSGAEVKIYVEKEEVGTLDTRARNVASETKRFEIPMHRLGGATPPEWMEMVTQSRGPTFMGLSFESIEPGVIYDSIGPVGADARVYLSLDKESLRDHMKAAKPNLVVLMVGGNDALMVRQNKRTLAQVKKDHVALIRRLKKYAPQSACLMFGPMDAAERLDDGTVVTKRFVPEINEMQREVAKEEGCAFWDTFASMGGPGAFGVWLEEGIMNQDLVHPRSKGGDLLGHLFARALMDAYLGR